MLSQWKKWLKVELFVNSGRYQYKVQDPGGGKVSKDKFSQQEFYSVNH